ncbi:hypothetical protein GCM10027258_41030 [Amycolatopsis stemonae]
MPKTWCPPHKPDVPVVLRDQADAVAEVLTARGACRPAGSCTRRWRRARRSARHWRTWSSWPSGSATPPDGHLTALVLTAFDMLHEALDSLPYPDGALSSSDAAEHAYRRAEHLALAVPRLRRRTSYAVGKIS